MLLLPGASTVATVAAAPLQGTGNRQNDAPPSFEGQMAPPQRQSHAAPDWRVLVAALDRTPFAVGILQLPSLDFVYANAAFAEFAPGETLIGRHYSDVFPEAAALADEVARQVLARRRVGSVALWLAVSVTWVRTGSARSCVQNPDPFRRAAANSRRRWS